MLADNYTVIPNAQISYIGWLTKESTLKRASSIVVEFTEPEMANAIIYAGMAWEGHIHQCQLYDRACRIKQCFRCYNYGHIGTQCNASQVCGYCAEQHESKHCQQKGVEGFTPRCAVCKGAHTAWSNACPARRKEMRRVEQAKEIRSVYWHVTLREKTAKPETYRPRNMEARQDDRNQRPDQTQRIRTQAPTATQILEEVISNTAPGLRTAVAPSQAGPSGNAQVPREASAPRTPVADSIEEAWETPATQQESTQRPDPIINLVDPQIMATDVSLSAAGAENSHPQPSVYPLDGLEEAALQDADTWLQNMTNNNSAQWPFGSPEAEASPITSLATDTRTAQGQIYKGCTCPSHQEIYRDWPTHDAELIIAKCMRTCMYCGKDFPIAAELRRHMRKRPEYAQRNVIVRMETPGKGSACTPAWAPIIRPNNRMTRSQSLTRSTSIANLS